jgi:hypothetical protein
MRTLVLSLTLAFSLIACSNKGDINTDDTGSTGNDSGASDDGSGGDADTDTDSDTDSDSDSDSDTDTDTDSDTDTDTDTDTDGSGDCAASVDSTWPEDGATGVAFGEQVIFYLSEGDPTAAITVAGVAGSSSLNGDEDVVTFTPDSPLSGGTTFVATLTYCGGVEVISFTTEDLGDPTDPDDLPGTTWSLDLSTGTISEPAGLETVLGVFGFTLEYSLLIGVEAVTEDEIDLIGALPDSTGAAQDYCALTVDFPTADFSLNPYFQVGPEDLSVDIAGYAVDVQDVYLSGTISSDASEVTDVEFAGLLDITPIAEAVGYDASSLCSLMGSFGISCEDCGDGNETCLGLVISEMSATELGGVELEGIDQEDCHEMCSASASNPDCEL